MSRLGLRSIVKIFFVFEGMSLETWLAKDSSRIFPRNSNDYNDSRVQKIYLKFNEILFMKLKNTWIE